MGHGTESRFHITLVEDDVREPGTPVEGTWMFSIIHGPTFMVHEAFTDIGLEVISDDGKQVQIEIDPNAPTIETIEKLASSGSPILEALFRGNIHMLVD